tara:strand:- start:28379 stop:28723 length:345 start_codon:yes stop_codon:yes gene_type:complete
MDLSPATNFSFPSLMGADPLKPSAAQASESDAAQLKEVAKGFEAVFLRHMLATAAAADFGGEDLFGSSGSDTFREMRDARFAEIAAATGTIGLATQIEAQLARHLGQDTAEGEG